MRPKYIYDDLYGCHIYMFIQWTEEEFNKYLKRKYKSPGEKVFDANGFTADFVYEEKYTIIMWTRKGSPAHCLVHEITHVTNFVLKHAGIKPSFTNDETQAYYNQRLYKIATGA